MTKIIRVVMSTLLALSAMALGSVTLGAAPASAHSQIISTSPTDGAVLDAPPTEVRLTFDAPLLQETDTMSINDADGNVVSSIHPTPEGASVAIPWPADTKPGVYQVAYRVVCGDGHPEIGALNITVNGSGGATAAVAAGSNASPAAAQSNETPTAAAATAPSSGMPAIILAAAVLIAGAIVAVAFLARRRTPSTTD